ncbi:MAG: T9SS type A sorting domain-containing protein [Chitinophagaceae bacterium]
MQNQFHSTFLRKEAIMLALLLTTPFVPIAAQTMKGLPIYSSPRKNAFFNDPTFPSMAMPDSNTIAVSNGYYGALGSWDSVSLVYSWDGSKWQLKGKPFAVGNSYNNVGYKVAMPDRNTLALAADGNDIGDFGEVDIYHWDGNDWGSPSYSHLFWRCASTLNIAMADSNNIAIRSQYRHNGNVSAPTVETYSYHNSAWQLKGKAIQSDTNLSDFGSTLSMPDANTLCICASGVDEANPGYVKLYKFDATLNDWKQEGKTIFGEINNHDLNWNICMPDSETLAIGTPNTNIGGTNTGKVRIYTLVNNEWVQKGVDLLGLMAGDQFGYSVAMPNNNTLAIGAPNHSENGSAMGQVSIFSWDGRGWLHSSSNINGTSPLQGEGKAVVMPDEHTVGICSISNDKNYNKITTVYNQISGLNVHSLPNTSIVLYPNPNNGSCVLDLGRAHIKANVCVRNLLGQLLQQIDASYQEKIMIDLPEPTGIYFVGVETEEAYKVFKVQKQ